MIDDMNAKDHCVRGGTLLLAGGPTSCGSRDRTARPRSRTPGCSRGTRRSRPIAFAERHPRSEGKPGLLFRTQRFRNTAGCGSRTCPPRGTHGPRHCIENYARRICKASTGILGPGPVRVPRRPCRHACGRRTPHEAGDDPEDHHETADHRHQRQRRGRREAWKRRLDQRADIDDGGRCLRSAELCNRRRDQTNNAAAI